MKCVDIHPTFWLSFSENILRRYDYFLLFKQAPFLYELKRKTQLPKYDLLNFDFPADFFKSRKKWGNIFFNLINTNNWEA